MTVSTSAKTSRATIALFTILVLTASFGNLSQTAVNSMLNSIVADFGIGVSLGQWLTTLYMMSLGISVTLSHFLWKRMGNRAYTLLSLALMVIGSLIDFTSTVFWFMVVGRVFQAFSAGFAMPVMQNVAMTGFPARRHGTAMGIGGIAMGFAPNIGPTVGGLFVGSVGWRWFFMFMVAVAVVLAVFTLALVRDDGERDRSRKLSFSSFVICAIGFGGLLFGCSDASNNGLDSLMVWIPIAVGAVFIVLFVRRQRRISNPLIDMKIFESRRYKTGFWMQNLLFGSFMGITLVLPLLVEGPLGGTASDAGLVLFPGAMVALVCNPLSGILGDKIGKANVVRIFTTICAIGSLLPFTFSADSSIWYIAICQAVRGVGVSSTIGCLIAWMLEGLSGPITGHGSSFGIALRQVSSSLGTAIMVFLVTSLAGIGSEMFAYKCAFAFSAVLAICLAVAAQMFAREGNDRG